MFLADKKEVLLSSIYRIYSCKISNGTSINFSANYVNANISFTDYDLKVNKGNYSLGMLCSYLQQNFFNEKFRPYALVGLGIAYIKAGYSNQTISEPVGLQKNFGFIFVLGAGVEYNIYKGLMLKAEYKNDIFSHLINVGIAYNFLHKK